MPNEKCMLLILGQRQFSFYSSRMANFRATKKVLSANKSHNLCASVERLYLTRGKGGWGMILIQHKWENEQVSLVQYLHNTTDHWLKVVLYRFTELIAKEKANPLLQSRQVLDRYGVPAPTIRNEAIVLKQEVKAAQQRHLEQALEVEAIHGTYRMTINNGKFDKESFCAWLKDGRFRSETEALLLTAQDGTLLLNQYSTKVKTTSENPKCRVLSESEEYKWSLYKTHHDKILSEVVKAIGEKWDLSIPHDGVTQATYNTPNGTIMVDIMIPTDQKMTARRPDLIIRNKKVKGIWILDVACAWDPLFEG